MLVEKPRLQDGKENYNQVPFTKHSLVEGGWKSHVTRACRKESLSDSERQPLFPSSVSDGHEDSQPGMRDMGRPEKPRGLTDNWWKSVHYWEGHRSLGD